MGWRRLLHLSITTNCQWNHKEVVRDERVANIQHCYSIINTTPRGNNSKLIRTLVTGHFHMKFPHNFVVALPTCLPTCYTEGVRLSKRIAKHSDLFGSHTPPVEDPRPMLHNTRVNESQMKQLNVT